MIKHRRAKGIANFNDSSKGVTINHVSGSKYYHITYRGQRMETCHTVESAISRANVYNKKLEKLAI